MNQVNPLQYVSIWGSGVSVVMELESGVCRTRSDEPETRTVVFVFSSAVYRAVKFASQMIIAVTISETQNLDYLRRWHHVSQTAVGKAHRDARWDEGHHWRM